VRRAPCSVYVPGMYMYVCSARQEPEASYLHIYIYTQGLAGYVATYLDFFFLKKKKEKKRK